MKFLQIAGCLINADRIESIQGMSLRGFNRLVIEVRDRDRPIIRDFDNAEEADEALKDLVHRLDGEVIDLP